MLWPFFVHSVPGLVAIKQSGSPPAILQDTNPIWIELILLILVHRPAQI